MTINTGLYGDYAGLAEASYGDFEHAVLIDDVKAILMSGDGKCSNTQASDLLSRWSVVEDGYVNVNNEYSSTLFQSTDTENPSYVLAIRGAWERNPDLVEEGTSGCGAGE